MNDCCALNSGPLSDDEAAHYAKLFSCVAEPARLRILSEIAGCGCDLVTVNELAERIGLSQPTVSHHLKKLTESGLVTREQRGRWAHYTAVAGVLDVARDFLGEATAGPRCC